MQIPFKEVKTIKTIGDKQGYIIHEVTKDNYCLCKILKEYNNIEDAKADLVKLLSNNTKEKDLLKGK